MKIYKLTPVHPTIIGYPYATTQDEIQFYQELFATKIYTGESASEHWKPTLMCDLNKADIGRILQGNQELWVFTEKARKALAPLLGNKVEYLPFLTKETLHERFTKRQLQLRKTTIDALLQIIHPEQQYLVNVLDIQTAEILNPSKSEYIHDEDDDMIYGIEKLAFFPEKIENNHLFKIKNPGIYFRNAMFVSDEFRKIVEQQQLVGLKFSELPENEGGNLIWQSV